MPRFAANLSFLFTDLPFLDRFEAAAKAGFKGVEFMFPYATPANEIRTRLDANGLELVLFNLPPGHWDKGERGFAALPGREDEFASAVDLALTYADALGCRRLHAMAGLTDHGATREVYVANLRLAAAWAAEQGVDILIEPINTRDMPGYFLTRTSDAADIIAEVDASNLGLQFDLYHRHIMEGGVEAAIAEFATITRHYQCADPPDRGEPGGSGELDYAALFRAIDASGHKGWIGCEYKPRGETLAGLGWPAACDVTLA
ncbi:2-oxo-tetronate isomerase [Hyphomicrobium sp.]|uniref:2-oxo-tetronate isomerase n=1 Tax=Hyphomicrobium sp. TaxID=82 RepID=UPI002CD5CE2A|nr:2-oxo-tetronate isomerase [Hyphomicrobium sp.]HRN89684.1 hydroxypyruvate isomerase family protein [Hyphomicrobium sp.]HRQ26039.1 hydroxypyruvate isomerase family protein [Hyphomicrobium sp.]